MIQKLFYICKLLTRRIFVRVSNPTMATNNVEDYRHSTHLLAATTLRYTSYNMIIDHTRALLFGIIKFSPS